MNSIDDLARRASAALSDDVARRIDTDAALARATAGATTVPVASRTRWRPVGIAIAAAVAAAAIGVVWWGSSDGDRRITPAASSEPVSTEPSAATTSNPPANEPSTPGPATAGPATAGPDATLTYRTVAAVIQTANDPLPLVAFGFRESYPPQGGEVPVEGLSWEDIPDRVTANGVTWTDTYYTFTGHFAGDHFVVASPPTVEPPPEPYDPMNAIGCSGTYFDAGLPDDMRKTLGVQYVMPWKSGPEAGERCGYRVMAYWDSPALRDALAERFGDLPLEYVFSFEAVGP